MIVEKLDIAHNWRRQYERYKKQFVKKNPYSDIIITCLKERDLVGVNRRSNKMSKLILGVVVGVETVFSVSGKVHQTLGNGKTSAR
jgi:hypothetical protein